METVAPHAGAWIKTVRETDEFGNLRVAPHAGAWIKTSGVR